MKKILATLLAGILAFSCMIALADETDETVPEIVIPEYDYDELTVAVTTPMTGNFFTSLWGNNTSDMDVRAMIHGYDLIYWNVADGVFLPDDTVVNSIAVTQDPDGNRTYTMVLNDDLKWSDGTAINAWDYAFSILLTMSNEAAQIGGNVKKPAYIMGYDEYISGEAKALSGVRVVADDQISVTVKAEYLPFFYELGLLDCSPYPISVIAPGVKVADDGEGVYLDGPFTAELLRGTVLDEASGYRTHPSLSCGPYVLTGYADGTAKFEINPYFKGDPAGNKPTIKRVTFRSMGQEELIPALESGEVGLVNKVTRQDVVIAGNALGGNNEFFGSANYARTGLSFISFNTDVGVTADKAVRQAIAWAADKDGIVQSTVSAFGIRTEGYYGLGQWMFQLVNGTLPYPVEEPAAGASAEETAKYEEELAKWEELSVEDIPAYTPDLEKAAALLDEAGWSLNEKGEAFTPGTDKVRCRKGDAGVEPLKLTLAYAEGSGAGAALEGALVESLAQAGIELAVTAIPMADLLPQYYHVAKPEYDMFFLASNFDLVFDPSVNFVKTDEGQVWQTSGLPDDALYEKAVAMRQTEPGDLLTYCTNWLDFQKEIAEQLPILPVYSNIYFDFYPRVLHEYAPGASISWPQAIVSAYMADYEFEDAEAEEAGDEIFEG